MEIIVIIKLFVTFIASLIFGLERQRNHKNVAFGTFIFVALGSCALGIIAISNTLINSISLLSAVVTGIGFLGAGALIKGTDKVYGFTTAASIWLFAIFGLAIGIEEYIISGTVYILMWIVILFDRHLEKEGMGSYQRRLVLTTNNIINEKEIKNYLSSYTKKYRLLCAEINKEKNEMYLVYLIEGARDDLNNMIRNLYKEKWLKSSKVE